MKIRVLEVEAGADEVKQVPELVDLIRRLGPPQAVEAAGAPEGAASQEGEAGDSAVGRFIVERGVGNPNVALVDEFVGRVLEFGEVEVGLGKSKSSPDGLGPYLMLKHTNHRVGAIAYVTPGNGSIGLRLDREWAEGRRYAKEAKVQDHDRYQVRVVLTEPAAVDEAVELAWEAHSIAAR